MQCILLGKRWWRMAEYELFLPNARTGSGRRSFRLLAVTPSGRRIVKSSTSWIRIAASSNVECDVSGVPGFPSDTGLLLLRGPVHDFVSAFPIRAGATRPELATCEGRFLAEWFRAYPVTGGFRCSGVALVTLPDGTPTTIDPDGPLCDAAWRNFYTHDGITTPQNAFPAAGTRAVWHPAAFPIQESFLPEESERPDRRGSAGRIQPVFSIRCSGREVALRRLSRSLTWIGSDHDASIPILHPRIAPAHCAVCWNGETVSVLRLPGAAEMVITSLTGTGLTGIPTVLSAATGVREHVFRPSEVLQFGAEIEIHFPGFTQLGFTQLNGPIRHESISGSENVSGDGQVVFTTAMPLPPVPPVSPAPTPTTDTAVNELLRRRYELEQRQREELAAQQAELAAIRAQQLDQERASLAQQRRELEQQRVELAAQRESLRVELVTVTEEKRRLATADEQIRRERRKLDDDRVTWLDWRRRYESQIFRLAAEFAEHNTANAGNAGTFPPPTATPVPGTSVSGTPTLGYRVAMMESGTETDTENLRARFHSPPPWLGRENG